MQVDSYTIGSLDVGDCIFEGNQAHGLNYFDGGGAINLNGVLVTASINNTTFSTNVAAKAGGALFGKEIADVLSMNVSFESNKADQNGGGCYFEVRNPPQ